jgi:EAL domain-containing protein (putative c-di-GMP-specific phosphodiesterase class I)
MTERVAEKLALENRLRLAVANAEFVLYYQPKADLKTRRITGVEAMLRWQNPELGLVPPSEFMPLLEETGLILQVSAWVLRQAVRDHREWRDAGLNPPRVAVNVSPVQLHQMDFLPNLLRAIGEAHAAETLDIKITESLVMADVEENIGKLTEIRAAGLGVGIAEFGTGNSSLAYLARLPAQSLKIDHSLIAAMLANAHTMTLVSTIISLAHSLHLTVIADGVDTEDQAKTLRLLRCDQMQGALFSAPLPKDEFALLLLREK